MFQPPRRSRHRVGETGWPDEVPIKHRRGHGVLPALVAAAIIIGSGAVGALALLPPADPGPARLTVPAPNPTTTDSTTTSPTTAADPRPVTLREQEVADRATVTGLVDGWVPQLSSLAEDGPDEARVWDQYQRLRARFPEVAVLRSGDFRSFARPGRWVVVLSRSFGTATAANAWCDRQRLAPDDCFAKRLSRTGGPGGNTVLRR